jgi:hypothetical protein
MALIIEGQGISPIQSMIRVRRVCKAWKRWVDGSDVYSHYIDSYLEKLSAVQRPWWRGASTVQAALNNAHRREKIRSFM